MLRSYCSGTLRVDQWVDELLLGTAPLQWTDGVLILATPPESYAGSSGSSHAVFGEFNIFKKLRHVNPNFTSDDLDGS